MKKQLEKLIGMVCNQGFYLEVEKFLNHLARLCPGHPDDDIYFRALLNALRAKLVEYPVDPESKPELSISIDDFCAKYSGDECRCKYSTAPLETSNDEETEETEETEESEESGRGKKTHKIPNPDESQKITEMKRPKLKM